MMHDRNYEKQIDLDGKNVKSANKLPTTFTRVTTEMESLYYRKNSDYGNSFDKSLDEDGLLVAKIRIGDKYNRFAQLLKKDAQITDESIQDTLIDLANYTVMTLMWMRNKGTNTTTKQVFLNGEVVEEFIKGE